MEASSSLQKGKGKKRKHDEAEESSSGDQIKFVLSEETSGAVGPVLASFPALQPPSATAFSVRTFGQAGQDDSKLHFAQKNITIVGETDRVHYFSTDESEDVKETCQYYVGIRDKRTNVVTLRPAPVQVFARRVKNLETVPSPSKEAAEDDFQVKRANLGEAFGTKKALKEIRARERNRIDASAMQDVSGHIQASIENNSSGLPTAEQSADLSLASRQLTLPPFDTSATTPDKVYPLYDMIPESEFMAIPVKGLINADDEQSRLKFIPFAGSTWIRNHLQANFNGTVESAAKVNKRQLRLITYIACLMAFRSGAKFGKLTSKDKLSERLRGIPAIVVDGILARFTEKARGSEESKFTGDCGLRLTSHIFALMLHADKFACDTAVIAADLRESVQNVNTQFKALGCKVDNLSAGDCIRLGLPPPGGEEKLRRAVLKAPVKFPTPRNGKRR